VPERAEVGDAELRSTAALRHLEGERLGCFLHGRLDAPEARADAFRVRNHRLRGSAEGAGDVHDGQVVVEHA
jgi:hypothetical protein